MVCERKVQPKLMVDLATLTGAIIVALETDMQECLATERASR